MPTRNWNLKAGSYSAEVRGPEDIRALLLSLLVDLSVESHPAQGGLIDVWKNSSGTYTIRSNGRVWCDQAHKADVPDEVVHMLLRAALDAETSLVHIHAGGVALSGQTVILAGWPGSGKSTAISALVSAGFGYITDERLAISPDGCSVSGFPKPISLIEGSFDVLERLNPERTGHGASNGTTWQIPASSIGQLAPQDTHRPSILVFIRHQDDASLRCTEISTVEAASRLLCDSPDVLARGSNGARAIVALAASVASVEIEYNELQELVGAVRDVLDNPSPINDDAPIELRGIASQGRRAPELPSEVDTSDAYAVVDGVSAWVLHDGAIAYIHSAGSVIEIDSAKAIWLELFDADHTVDELIAEVAAATQTDVASIRATARKIVHALWAADVIGPAGDT